MRELLKILLNKMFGFHFTDLPARKLSEKQFRISVKQFDGENWYYVEYLLDGKWVIPMLSYSGDVWIHNIFYHRTKSGHISPLYFKDTEYPKMLIKAEHNNVGVYWHDWHGKFTRYDEDSVE